MVIQHNLEAMASSGYLGKIVVANGKSTEKLSSGYRINRSADDAAGLAISEKMRRQIRGLTQASANSQDGISLCQIADGALEETSDMLHRMEELAVKAANGTNSEKDREYIQEEIDQLVTEVDRISDTTVFNELKLLDGSLQKDALESTGIEKSNYISVDAVIDSSISGAQNLANANALSDALTKSIVPQAVKSIMSTYPSLNAAFSSGMVSSKIGLNVYTESSSTLAAVACSYGYSADKTINRDISLSLEVNINSLSFKPDGTLTDDSRKDLESTIAHEMIHAFMDDTMLNGMIGVTDDKLDSKAKFPGWFTEGMAQTAGGAYEDDGGWIRNGTIKNNTKEGGLGIESDSTIDDISATLRNSNKKLGSNTFASKYGTGYLATMYLGYMAAGGGAVSASNIAGGLDTIMNKIINGKDLSEVISEISGGKYKDIPDFQRNFGDVASSQFALDLTKAVGATGRGSVIGSLSNSDLYPDTDIAATAYGVDASNAFVQTTSTKKNSGSGAAGVGGGSGASSSGEVFIQVGAEANQHIDIYIDEMSAEAIGIDGLSVLTQEDADDAINRVKDAILKVSKTRSDIGAYQNRLEHTIKNLDNVVENTTAAESLIRDTDMAKEMVRFSNNNILIQAGQAMLAQANQSKQGILSLLG